MLKEIAKTDGFEFISLKELAAMHPKLLKALSKLGATNDSSQIFEDINDEARRSTDSIIRRSETEGIKILSFIDQEYPRILSVTPDAPAFIHVKWVLPNNCNSSVAVIWTRNPTPHGKIMAERIAGYFAAEKWSVVSGLAIGCDTVAHEAAVNVWWHTIAVLAHGLHTVAPAQNKHLAHKILDSWWALMSEYGIWTEPTPYAFASRDRIQAWMSKGTVMVQSGIDGGSLIASVATLKYGRILAVPVPTDFDVKNDFSRIEANTILIRGSLNEKADMLWLENSKIDFGHILPIRDKSDYAMLSSILRTHNSENITQIQETLFGI